MIWHVLHSDHGIQFRTTTPVHDWTMLVFEPSERTSADEALVLEQKETEEAEEDDS